MDHIQEVCAAIKGIRDCAMVEVDDAVELYKGVLFVVPETGFSADEKFKKYLFCEMEKPIKTGDQKIETLKPFERPAYIVFIKELPRRNGMNKIDYAALKEQAHKITYCQ